MPRSVTFGMEGDVAASFLRVNGVEPKTSPEVAPQIAAGGEAFTVKVMCVQASGSE